MAQNSNKPLKKLFDSLPPGKHILMDLDGNVAEIIDGALLTTDYLLEVARGNISGQSLDKKFGKIDEIQIITPADIWEYGITVSAENYTWSANGVADIDMISSSSASDTEDITIIGLDISGNEVTQIAILDGQNKVSLTTDLWRVNRVYNSNGIDLVGNVYIYVDGDITTGVPDVVTTVRGYISIGSGQTYQAVYTVPNGKTAYVMGMEASLINKKTAIAEFEIKTRSYEKVFRVQDVFNLATVGSSTKNYNFPIPLPYPGKTDICPIANVSVNDVGASLAYTLLLIDD